MRAIVSDLQRVLFQADDERVVSAVNLIRIGNKKLKKATFLCLAVTINQPISVRLYFVKSGRDNSFRKKENFNLRSVKIVDGINPRKSIPEFEILVGEKLYRLCASSADEKDAFIKQMYKFASKYLPVQKPDFINVPVPVETPHVVVAVSEAEDDTDENLADYQPISAKEEADFRRLLARANLTIADAEKFANVLVRQLQLLDGANIQSIMDSEAAVNDLIALIDRTLEEVCRLDNQLDVFDKLLYHVRENVELIDEKDSLGCVERKNTRVLRETLSEFIEVMDTVTEEHMRVLRNASLSDPSNISRCCEAARAVQTFWSKKVHPSLKLMAVYQDRTHFLQKLTDDFIEKFMAYLSALFCNLNELLEVADVQSLVLRKQSERFHALRPFSDLIGWLKSVRPLAYQNAIQRYVQNTSAIYKKEFERFFEAVGTEVQKLLSSERKLTTENADRSGLEKVARRNKVDPKALTDLIEIIWGESGSVIEAEQKFCLRFFHMTGEILKPIDNMLANEDNANLGRDTEKLKFDQEVSRVVEDAFADADRRTDLDRWYGQLISSLKAIIERAANLSYSKSPSFVVRFENYHRLYSILSELKIECLDGERREAKKAYQENLHLYIRNSMGRPLEKLHAFFQNVESAMQCGVKPEEIAFRQEFSKSELKKVISLYPSREVKKALSQLYKKVDKHLLEESHLLQVVWRNMQEEFIIELQQYQALIGQCYPNSGIVLEVSLQDVLNYFSQIAQEH